MGYRVSKIISKWRQLWTGPSTWAQLIGLFSDEANVNGALRGLKLIYVPYGHNYGPAKGKDHALERVGSSDLECPLVHDSLEKSCEVHLAAINTARSQVTMLSVAVGERQ